MAQIRIKWMTGAALAALLGLSGAALAISMAPVNDLPNPYQSADNWFKLPAGRKWGSTAGVAIAPDGKSVSAVDRCGGNGCVGSKLNAIIKLNATGYPGAAISAGHVAFPQRLHVAYGAY